MDLLYLRARFLAPAKVSIVRNIENKMKFNMCVNMVTVQDLRTYVRKYKQN